MIETLNPCPTLSQSSGQDEMPSTVAGGVLRADSVDGTATMSKAALSLWVFGRTSADFYKHNTKVWSPLVMTLPCESKQVSARQKYPAEQEGKQKAKH